jgi:type I restriction enzyme S subunit
MISEWVERPLGDLIALQRGHDLPAGKRIPGAVPIMGSAGVTGYHDKATTAGPGVVIGRSGVGSMGVVSYIDRDYWALNTSLYVTDFRGNDVKFIYYLLSTINFRQFDTGSAQASLNRNLVYPHRVRVPSSVTEQKEIARTLSAIDDRIALLRETNSTLEAIAQALFKSWFVDFDPVHDRQEGRVPEGMDEATAGLFPDRFDELELGVVPRGWQMCSFTDVVNVIGGGTP